MRLVLDTSVVASATRSSRGASRLLVDGALHGDFELLLSVPLTFEYEAVLTRRDQMDVSGLAAEEIDELLSSLLRLSVKVDLEKYTGPTSPDPGDNHVLSLAFHGNADGIVSFNTRDFAIPSRTLGVKLLTPAEALRLLRN